MPAIRQLRTRVLIACEGESERSYSRFLGLTAESIGLPLHIDAQVCGGGDPLALVVEAERIIARRERAHGPYAHKCLLHDADRWGQAPARDADATTKARMLGLTLIEQDPDHEGLLLRHLPNCSALRPPTGASRARLEHHWPAYRKPSSADELLKLLQTDGLMRVVAVEPTLAAFLREIGFPV